MILLLMFQGQNLAQKSNVTAFLLCEPCDDDDFSHCVNPVTMMTDFPCQEMTDLF